MIWLVIVLAQPDIPPHFPYVLLHHVAPPGLEVLNPHRTREGCERERDWLIADWKTVGMNIEAECRGYPVQE